MPDSLFVVTNRSFRQERESGNYVLGDALNPKGARELRLFEARPHDEHFERWLVEAVPNKPKLRDFESDGVQPVREKDSYNGSDLVAARLVSRLRLSQRNLLLFIHGYNNTFKDASEKSPWMPVMFMARYLYRTDRC